MYNTSICIFPYSNPNKGNNKMKFAFVTTIMKHFNLDCCSKSMFISVLFLSIDNNTDI